MKLDSYYLYGITNKENLHDFDIDYILKMLEKILKSGEIKSRRLRGITKERPCGWNGLDYISLCDYRRRNNTPYEGNEFYRGYTAYETYICRCLSFILTKYKVDAIKPTLEYPIIFDWDSHFTMYRLGNSKEGRYSDLLDEVQVKDRISLDRVKGMTIPIDYLVTEEEYGRNKVLSVDEIIYLFNSVKELLIKYNISNNIYDLKTQSLIKSDEDILRITEEIYARNRK